MSATPESIVHLLKRTELAVRACVEEALVEFDLTPTARAVRVALQLEGQLLDDLNAVELRALRNGLSKLLASAHEHERDPERPRVSATELVRARIARPWSRSAMFKQRRAR